MQAKQLILVIDFFIIDAVNIFPDHGTAFGSGEVFHGMKGKTGEVGYRTDCLPLIACPKRMSSISSDCDSANSLLYFISRLKNVLFIFYNIYF